MDVGINHLKVRFGTLRRKKIKTSTYLLLPALFLAFFPCFSAQITSTLSVSPSGYMRLKMQLGNGGIRNTLLYEYITNCMAWSVCVCVSQSKLGLTHIHALWRSWISMLMCFGSTSVCLCMCVRESASLALLMLHLC